MSWLVQGFEGPKAGLYFGTGQFGLGYYTDIRARSAAASDDDVNGSSSVDSRQPKRAGHSRGNPAGERHKQERDAAQACTSKTEEVGSSAAGPAGVDNEEADRPVVGNGQQPDNAPAASGQPASATDADEDACTTSGDPQEESSGKGEARGGPAHAQQRPRHYWGQALQYLEKSADVTKGPAHHLLSLNICATSGDALAKSLSQGLHAGSPLHSSV